MTEKKQTFGKLALELQKDSYKQDVIETQRQMQKQYPEELFNCAKRHEDHVFSDGVIGKDKPYYVLAMKKRERLFKNSIRTYFFARRSRPIPDYDIDLYYYDPASENLTFVWSIPDKESVEEILINKNNLPQEFDQLIHFCQSFKDNTLV